jgi:protein-S-isoprenylcysteine O-methyltransferase Ste14
MPSDESAAVAAGVRKWLIEGVVFLAVMLALLFGSSGRLDWPMAWALVGMFLAFQIASAIAFLPKSPEFIAERSGFPEGTRTWDIVIAISAALSLPAISALVAGLDLRFGWRPEIPAPIKLAALLVAVAGVGLVFWSMLANRFFSSMVRIQHERGHTVVSAGPYRYVRHPGYVGVMTYTLAMPVMLGSVWALVPSGVAAILFVVRTALEDRILRRDLEGYTEYAGRVCYRLLPGIW